MSASLSLMRETSPLPSAREDTSALPVEVFDSEDEFRALQHHWEALHAKDPEAGFFLSWGWISKVFEQYPGRMRVLAVKRDPSADDYVAFFPVASRIRWSTSRQKFQGLLQPGGRTALSEHTGFVCDPGHEKPAIAALATFVCSLPWTQFSMRYEPTCYRSEHFLNSLPQEGFKGKSRSYFINGGTIDNLITPQIPLPESYDAYLAMLSANTRQKIRRFARRQLDSGLWHITQVTAQSVEKDIEVLIDLWRKQWGVKKKSAQARKTASIYRSMMQTCFELGVLHLPILWCDEAPLVAHGCIADANQGHVHFVLSGRNMDQDQQNAGLLLHCNSVQIAIERGFGVYDFGHGNEAYKSSLGGRDKRVGYIEVERLGDAVRETIDPNCLADPARKIRSFIEKEEFATARKACSEFVKIMEALPGDTAARPTQFGLKEA